jgi:hypothetical protein
VRNQVSCRCRHCSQVLIARREVYNTSIRQRALETLLIGIESQPKALVFSIREDSLISRLLKLPLTEIEIFVSEMIACLPDDRYVYS